MLNLNKQHFSMKNTVESCDHDQRKDGATFCVTSATYLHDVKHGSSAVWPFQDLQQAIQNSKAHNF